MHIIGATSISKASAIQIFQKSNNQRHGNVIAASDSTMPVTILMDLSVFMIVFADNYIPLLRRFVAGTFVSRDADHAEISETTRTATAIPAPM
jgi:hypothetical protein